MRHFLLVFLVISTGGAAADLFDSHEPLEIVLKGPLKDTNRDRGDDATERDFTITVDDVDVPVQVRTRGNFRLEHCTYPPLRLDFKKNLVTGSPFDGQDKVKLVVHCQNGRASKHNVLEEYLAYRFFNLVTDKSFRVRWLTVHYEESGKTHGAFVIESKQALAERLGGELLDLDAVDEAALDPAYQTLASIYQYAIGNTDFSFIVGEGKCCHNTTPIRVASGIVSVPYDFDRAGLVDAAYVLGNGSLEQKDVAERIYRGFCTPDDIWHAARQPFLGLQPAFNELVAELPDMSGFARGRAKRYLGDFFIQLRRKDGRTIARQCR